MFCNCLLVVAGKPGMKKKNVVFVCCFFDQQKTAPYEAQSDLRPCLRLSHGNKDKVVVVGAQKSGRAGTGSVCSSAGEWKNGGGEGEERKKGEEAAEEERQKACS